MIFTSEENRFFIGEIMKFPYEDKTKIRASHWGKLFRISDFSLEERQFSLGK